MRTVEKTEADGAPRKPSDPLTREKFLKPLLRCVTSSALRGRLFSFRLRRSVSCRFPWNCSTSRGPRDFHLNCRGRSIIPSEEITIFPARDCRPFRFHGFRNTRDRRAARAGNSVLIGIDGLAKVDEERTFLEKRSSVAAVDRLAARFSL